MLISDFQQNHTELKPETDSLTNINLVKLKPVTTNNVSIDSVYISEKTPANIQLKGCFKEQWQTHRKPIPVSLFNDDDLIAKTAVNIDQVSQTTFTIPSNKTINGKVTIDDVNLQV